MRHGQSWYESKLYNRVQVQFDWPVDPDVSRETLKFFSNDGHKDGHK